jgi:DNA-binding protein H-NS
MVLVKIDKEAVMPRTLVQIKNQIEQLEKEAEEVRTREVAGVIQRIKTAIEFYDLTANDLFGPGRKTAESSNKVAPKKAKKQPTPPKYRDPATGKTWTGHGKRPGWFVQAIESGKNPEDLAL